MFFLGDHENIYSINEICRGEKMYCTRCGVIGHVKGDCEMYTEPTRINTSKNLTKTMKKVVKRMRY